MSPERSTDSNEDLLPNKAVDSASSLATAYRVRHLLVQTMRTLSVAVQERKARAFVMKICDNTYTNSLVKKAFFGLLVNWDTHRGHRQHNFIAQ